MRPRRIRLGPTFEKSFKRLPEEIRTATREALNNYINRSAERALQPEKKAGLRGIWAIRVTQGYRAFYFQEDDEQGRISVFVHVGPHDDYRRFAPKRWR